MGIKIGKNGGIIKALFGTHKIGEQVVCIALTCMFGKGGNRAFHRGITALHQAFPHLHLQARLFQFIRQFGIRHDTGLDREAAQYGLAKGMHCFDTRAIITIKNLSKQAARIPQH